METDQQLVPSVVAVMVVHEPGDWFDETLASLAGQDYANLRTLFLLNERDDEVDALRDDLIAEMMDLMTKRSEIVSPAMALIFIVQSIERVGDHAKNIAEYVVNVVEGVDMRHADESIASREALEETRRG